MSELLYLVLGWMPLWIAAAVMRQKLRPSRLLLGALVCGVAGGMGASEMRVHGLQAVPDGSILVPPLGLPLEELLRYALLGAAGALVGEIVLDRAERDGTSPRDSADRSADPDPPHAADAGGAAGG